MKEKRRRNAICQVPEDITAEVMEVPEVMEAPAAITEVTAVITVAIMAVIPLWAAECGIGPRAAEAAAVVCAL